MQVDPQKDRLVDVLLRQAMGGERVPDLTERILKRAFGGRRLSRVWKGAGLVAAAALVVVGSWLGFRALVRGPERDDEYPAVRIAGDYEVEDGRKIARGVRVTTANGSANLVLGGYCRVGVRPKTTVRIEGEDRSEQVFLSRGELTCNVDRDAGTFAVRTGLGTVSVTGTRFIVRLSRRKGGNGMFRREMFVKVLVGAVLVSGLSGEFALTEGEEHVVTEKLAKVGIVKEKPAEMGMGVVVEKEKPADESLPEGIHGFYGYIVGKVVSLDKKGIVLKVIAVKPLMKANKAKDPSCLVGKDVRILFLNKEVAAASRQIVAGKRTLTVRARTAKDNKAIFMVDVSILRTKGSGGQEPPRS